MKPTWKSSNGNLAVNGQSIKATKPGTSTLTAVSGDESYDASQGAGADDLVALTTGVSSAPRRPERAFPCR